MGKITSSLGQENYQVEIISASGNKVIADEPVASGGKDSGFSPTELLTAALAACTSATLRMYADRKNWDLQQVHTEIALERDETTTHIKRKVTFVGNLDDAQRTRLLAIANACPVHKILSNPIAITTTLL